MNYVAKKSWDRQQIHLQGANYKQKVSEKKDLVQADLGWKHPAKDKEKMEKKNWPHEGRASDLEGS
jgi:hypothetical protein